MNRPLSLYVYNNEYDVTRTVTITPARGWGGDGALGCVLGFGALHRVPAPLAEPTQAPGETMFETARFSNEQARPASALSANGSFQPTPSPAPPPTSQSPSNFLVPANMQFSATPPAAGGSPAGGPSKAGRKARAHHAVSPGVGLDDYFKEGEQKSKEQDNAPTKAATLPPPPKGGPPRASQE